MLDIYFSQNPDHTTIGLVFPESPYFSEEALSYTTNNQTQILTASVEGKIVAALSWEVPPFQRMLKIGEVEVLPDYRGNQIGSRLLIAAEALIGSQIYNATGYLSDKNNIASKNMFLRAGYTQKDEQKFYKVLSA